MKKILFISLLALAAIPFQNCNDGGGDDPQPDTTKTTKPKPVNTFKFNGITTYNLTWDSTTMVGQYRSTTDQTTITVTGFDGSKYAEFELKFPGNKIGSFKHSTNPDYVNISIATGSGVTRKEYEFTTQPNKEMTINVTKYDPILGRIKGTFSGDLQEAGSLATATISAGAFEVLRIEDQ
ncbi:MAG: hypothetical protein HUU47_02455 [Bacteroidetes bacterium]|nr:hypothetical protein [Bacteroidota bacterium]